VRNVVKLAGGTAGSQVITVVATPILTRLYGPESFGMLAAFASLLALLNVVSRLCYELAITLPEDDDEAIAIVWLCFVLVAISTALTALGVTLLGNQLVSLLHQPSLKPLMWLLPVGVLLTGVNQPLSYWAIRRKQFGLLAQTKFRQSIFGVATNLAAAPLDTIGLLLGQIVSQSAGSLAILGQSADALLRKPHYKTSSLISTLRNYSHFAIYSTPAGLLNVFANTAPILLFYYLYGPSHVGQLVIAQKMLLAPINIVSTSFGQVFLQKASEMGREKTTMPLLISSTKRLIVFSLPCIVSLSLILNSFAALVFGGRWSGVGLIVILLIPLAASKAVVGSVGQILFALGMTKLQLLAQTIFLLVSLLPILAYVVYTPVFQVAVMLWSLCGLVAYSLFWLLCLYGSHKSSSLAS
jgi:O-antigen/teichoic acid export membrane protein